MGNRGSKAAAETARTAGSTAARGQDALHRSANRNNANVDIKGEPTSAYSESKSSNIRLDASDPSAPSQDLLAKNLQSLGQAQIRSAQQQESTRFTPVSVLDQIILQVSK